VNVEAISLADNYSYNLTTADATVAAGETLTINGNNMSAVTQTLIFDGGAESDGSFYLRDGAGNDVFFGGAQSDYFDMGNGGDDAIRAGDGDDDLDFHSQFTKFDHLDGGAGFDTLDLAGDYSLANAVTFGSSTMLNVEEIRFNYGHSYTVTTHDNTVANGQTLYVHGQYLGSTDHLIFNGGAEADGSFFLFGGHGDDTLIGGAQDDVLDLTQGGNDAAYGGDGNDTLFLLSGALQATDIVDGGIGTNDAVILKGDYSGGLIFNATTIVGVEKIELRAGFSYNLATHDATVDAGKTLIVDGSALAASVTMTFDGSAETDGLFIIKSGNGSDELTGGAKSDTFSYFGVALSGDTRDTIHAFDFDSLNHDQIKFAAVSAIDAAVVGGSLDDATFDADLEAAVGAAQLASGHAVVFQPSSGSEAGRTFVIVDDGASGDGYQAGADLVIELASPTGSMIVQDFIA
jgi:Ca2+-binding RTX toxin-like protein